jgi:opacity protein-like surface antigen
MKKFWTLIASTMLVASAAFAQDDYDYADQSEEQATEQASEPWPNEDEQSSEAEPAEEAPAAPVAKQVNNQVTNQTNIQQANQVTIQNNFYAQANEAHAPASNAQANEPQESYERPANNEQKFGIGLRAAFDYGMMYGFKNEDDDVDGSPTGIGFEGGLMGRIQLVSNLHFAPEVNIAFVRTEHEYLHQKRTYTSIDLEIPLLMRGIVLDKFYVTGGPQLNLNLSNDFDYDNKDATEGYEEKIDEAKFTFGLAVGAGFNIIEGLFIDVRFYMGLMDLYPDVKSISDYEDGEIVSEGDDFSYISMKGAKMMKIKAGLSYWFI